MKNNSKTDNRIEEQINLTMQSTEGMQRAEANPFLYDKVISKINQPSFDSRDWNYNKGIKYALIMLLFIALNIATILQISKDNNIAKDTSIETSKMESKGYFDDFINNDSYNNF